MVTIKLANIFHTLACNVWNFISLQFCGNLKEILVTSHCHILSCLGWFCMYVWFVFCIIDVGGVGTLFPRQLCGPVVVFGRCWSLILWSGSPFCALSSHSPCYSCDPTQPLHPPHHVPPRNCTSDTIHQYHTSIFCIVLRPIADIRFT